MKVIEEHFESINQLLNVIDSRPNNSEMRSQHSSKEGDKSFTGTKNWNEAVELFQYGYKDVLDEIKSGIAKNVKCNVTEQRRHIRNGVVGYAPNVPNAIQGLPNSMIYTEKQPQKVKAVTIYYAPTENCGTGVKVFIKSGIAMLSAINILEMSGVRVNLNIVFFNGTNMGDTEGTLVNVKVKDFREHMDIQKLCFPVVHPSMFRRFGFKWLETTPKMEQSHWAYSYGHHSQKFNDIIRKNMKNDKMFITMNDVKNANYSLEKLIESLGVKK